MLRMLLIIFISFGPSPCEVIRIEPPVMKRLIKQKAEKYGLEFELVAALIWQESKGNPWATRVEEAFFSKYLAHLTRETLQGFVPSESSVSLPTEKWHRATSWGLMQCLGETMREKGFNKSELTRLCVPAINLEFGCRLLKSLLQKAPGTSYNERVKNALAAYNTGRLDETRTNYDEKVLEHIQTGAFNKMFE